MFVDTFTIDNVLSNRVTFNRQNLIDVESLIKSLDGITKTTITLEKSFSCLADNTFYMTISGANNNFVLYVMISDDYCFKPVSWSGISEDDWIILNVGGSFSKFTRNSLLDLKTTIKIAKTYVETGKLDTCVKWEQVQ